MKSAQTLATIVLTLVSFPLLAQQAGSADPQQSEAATTPPAATAPSVAMSPVTGELVDKLDSKTAKAGDSIVIKTKSEVKTADGTDIPKGSKLLGHVTAVKPRGQGNENSQVAVEFDRAELKGGQSVAIRSELESLSPSNADMPASDAGAALPSASAAAPSSGASGSMPNGGGSSPSANAAPAPSQPSSASPSGTAQENAPAAGTVVARSGNIAIRTTAIPGILLASNAPGQRDPRMGESSGILLGAKRDIHLDGGTRVILGVATGSGK